MENEGAIHKVEFDFEKIKNVHKHVSSNSVEHQSLGITIEEYEKLKLNSDFQI